MPAIRVNQANAWALWQQGRIGCFGADFGNAYKWVTPLAVSHGLNCIRLFLAYADEGYWLTPADFMRIGDSCVDDNFELRASASSAGWNLDEYSHISRLWRDQPKKIFEIGNRIQQVLDASEKVGMGVVLALNWWKGPGQRMWEPKAADATMAPDSYHEATTPQQVQNNLIKFWIATEARFGSHPALVGYDILNEPEVPDGTNWNALARRLHDQLRRARVYGGPGASARVSQVPLIVESIDSGAAKGFRAFQAGEGLLARDAQGRLTTQKVVFSFHAYAPFALTHQGLVDGTFESLGLQYPKATHFNNANLKCYPLRNADDLKAYFYKEAIDFKNTHGVPIFVGEFSMIDQAGDKIYCDAGAESPNRQVTEVVVAGGQTRFVMGNIDNAVFPDKYGFTIDQSDTDAVTMSSLTYHEKQPHLRNEVLVTIEPISEEIKANETESDMTKLVRRCVDDFATMRAWSNVMKPSDFFDVDAQGVSQLHNSTLKVVAAALAQYDAWLSLPDRQPDPRPDLVKVLERFRAMNENFVNKTTLRVQDQLISIHRTQTEYAFAANFGLSSLAPWPKAYKPVPVGGNGVDKDKIKALQQVQAAPLAIVSLKPSPANRAQAAPSRLRFAMDMLRVCQTTGMSWGWHGDGSYEKPLWNPTPAIRGVLKAAADGRRV